MTSYEEIVNFSEALRAAGIENELIELLNCDTLHEFINGVGENDIVVNIFMKFYYKFQCARLKIHKYSVVHCFIYYFRLY